MTVLKKKVLVPTQLEGVAFDCVWTSLGREGTSLPEAIAFSTSGSRLICLRSKSRTPTSTKDRALSLRR